MAHMASKAVIKKMKEEYEDLAVVCYINSTVELKTMADICVTSSNAVKIVRSLPNKNIFFIPDGNLGAYVKKLYPHHISDNSDGRKFIRKEREKTGVEFFVPLHPIAEKILSLYNTTDDSKPVFPLGEKKDIYLDVHTLGMVLGISNKLGFHASRHTFGVLMLNEDIPIGSIAKMMGHADITSTQVYAQVTEQKISNDMDTLIAKRERNRLSNEKTMGK